MKIHLIKRQSVLLFAQSQARSRVSFEEWLEKISYADWRTPTDIKQTFASADFLGRSSRRIVFDIGGNKYRIICKYVFGETSIHLFVCWIGTHKEYTKLCLKEMQYSIHTY